MKYININKIVAVICAGFVLVSVSGCQKKTTINDDTKKIVYEQSSNYQEEKVTNSKNNQSQTPKSNANVNSNVIINDDKEIEIISYFENLEQEVDKAINEDSFSKFKEKAKEIAITGIDFIFYGTEIKGVTFEQLSDNAKNKIMAIVSRIDNKVESKIPGYKETIKEKFTQGYDYVKTKLQEGLNYADDKLLEQYGDKYQDVKDKTKEVTQDIKESTKDVTNQIQDAASNGWSKIKNWYEEKTNKR